MNTIIEYETRHGKIKVRRIFVHNPQHLSNYIRKLTRNGCLNIEVYDDKIN